MVEKKKEKNFLLHFFYINEDDTTRERKITCLLLFVWIKGRKSYTCTCQHMTKKKSRILLFFAPRLSHALEMNVSVSAQFSFPTIILCVSH